MKELVLGARSPIGGRIRDAPEARCRPCEFHCNLSGSHRHFLYVDHAALLLFPAIYVLHEEPLHRLYFSTKAIKAPCALTTNVCALSENCGPSFRGL
jgi:hypothetical protein